MCFIFICEALVIVYILKHRSFSPVILWSAFEVAIIVCLQVLLSVFRASHTRSADATHLFQTSSELVEKVDQANQPKTIFCL